MKRSGGRRAPPSRRPCRPLQARLPTTQPWSEPRASSLASSRCLADAAHLPPRALGSRRAHSKRPEKIPQQGSRLGRDSHFSVGQGARSVLMYGCTYAQRMVPHGRARRHARKAAHPSGCRILERASTAGCLPTAGCPPRWILRALHRCGDHHRDHINARNGFPCRRPRMLHAHRAYMRTCSCHRSSQIPLTAFAFLHWTSPAALRSVSVLRCTFFKLTLAADAGEELRLTRENVTSFK